MVEARAASRFAIAVLEATRAPKPEITALVIAQFDGSTRLRTFAWIFCPPPHAITRIPPWRRRDLVLAPPFPESRRQIVQALAERTVVVSTESDLLLLRDQLPGWTPQGALLFRDWSRLVPRSTIAHIPYTRAARRRIRIRRSPWIHPGRLTWRWTPPTTWNQIRPKQRSTRGSETISLR
ncbi:hypothetical protein ACSDR0_25195 [Streptosporangium sp. G11]|uniref:hypothetical protein n=1 Tax=Streptosporangium sp. G11 TaxID=3436926 RepID=UPI003EBEC8D3